MTEKKDNDEHERSSKIKEIYRYDEMSNKVLQTDKRFQNVRTDPLRDAELSQPKSMKGRISTKEMGSQVHSTLGTDERELAEKDVNKVTDIQEQTSINISTNWRIQDNSTILGPTNGQRLKYYPTTQQNTEIYSRILEWVTKLLGNDMPHDVIVGTADLLIDILKTDDDNSDGLIDKKRESIQKDLQLDIDQSSFNELFKLIREISDFGKQATDDVKEDIINVLANSDEEENGEELNNLEQEVLMDNDEEEEENKDNNKNTEIQLEQSLLPSNKEDTFTISRLPYNVPLLSEISTEYIVDLLKLNNEETPSFSDIINILKDNKSDDESMKQNISKILTSKDKSVINFIVENKLRIKWGLRLSESDPSKVQDITKEMVECGLKSLVREYEQDSKNGSKRKLTEEPETDTTSKKSKLTKDNDNIEILDLETFKFDQGSNLMTTTKVSLPEGSFKRIKPNYEEIHIPAPEEVTIDYDLVPISSLPEWARRAFPSGETDTLNAVQSKVFPTAFETDNNVLLCAPTGAGKTNVAMLTVLRALSHFYNDETKKFNLSKIKVVYIAPLKALVQEQVREFQRRLSHFGIKVAELTGDSRLTRKEIAETQILVSTPEKWDVVTRKSDESWFTQLVKLIIIDEIHLLHDERGPVLESIVARTLWKNESSNPPRLVGLSATLPNYNDVANFLRVPKESVFYFDSSYRPCPLSQQFCGIKVEGALKKLNAMNEACYDKVLESVSEGNQIIVFVHSRKETARTAEWLKSKFIESDKTDTIVDSKVGSKEILNSEAENVRDPNLKKVITYGIGIHHAGLSRSDRSLSEDLFADGVVKILISTATLAWGVNLPAHTVIIKGTDIYSPEKGGWERLSPQDVLQMLGRAGRPRYDTHGDGIIITSQSDIQYYLAVLNQQLPIESQFISNLVNNLNAEVVSGKVKSIEDGVDWLSYTYLYVRMLTSPELYKISDIENDPILTELRKKLIHTAFHILASQNLLVYNREYGLVQATELGRIASYFYIKYDSMSTFNNELNEKTTTLDIFRIFTLSDEFKYISIRPEEMKEMKELYSKVPIPIQSDISDPLAKVNVLLQVYISSLKIDGFALNSDMIFIQQSAGRLFRAMFELCLKKGWSGPTKALLNICKSIDKRIWITNSPLRQFKNCPLEVIKRTESSNLPWQSYLSLVSPSEVGHAIRLEKHGKMVYDLIQRFPKLTLQCGIQPITPSLLNVELEIVGDWIWDPKLHGFAEPFLLLVEDINGDEILYSDSILIRQESLHLGQVINFSIQLSPAQQKRLPPNVFISVLSERWFHSEAHVTVNLDIVKLPKKYPIPTELVEMSNISTSILQEDGFSQVYDFDYFNQIQSNVFEAVYNNNENIFIGCPKGSGKIALAELSLLNHWRQNKGRALFVCPSQDRIDRLLKLWTKKFSEIAGGKAIGKLGENASINLRTIAENHLVLATPEQFDVISRRWRQRKNIQRIELVIFHDIHNVSCGTKGAIYENVVSRMMFISVQLEKSIRIIALSTSLSNARDFSDWIGVKKENIFNYSSQYRIMPLKIHLESFENANQHTFTPSMVKEAFEFCFKRSSEEPTPLIFLPFRKECIEVGIQLLTHANWRKWDLNRVDEETLETYALQIQDPSLKRLVKNGIGFIYKDMNKKDRNIIEKLYEVGGLSFLLAAKDCCSNSPKSDLVIVLSTHFYDNREMQYVNYRVNELLEMVGTSRGIQESQKLGNVLIFTTSNAKPYYRKFLEESLPTESYMYFHLHDAFISEISNSIIENKQDCVDWITYTYFYRRIHANPTFYGVKDTTEYGISAYLTELVESVINDLSQVPLIEVLPPNESDSNEDGPDSIPESISPLGSCLISSHNNVNFLTMHYFINNLSRSSTLRDLLEILSNANEFNDIALRGDDFSKLAKLQSILPLKFKDTSKANSSSMKVFTLLQAYFSRIELSFEFKNDLKFILLKIVPLINTIVDILSSNGYLNSTTAMDVSQMVSQAMWDVDSPLLQVPYFDQTILTKCSTKKIETVYDIMALEDDDREDILTMENKKLAKVANFINNYPNIEMKYTLSNLDDIRVGEPNTITVSISRDDEPENLNVVSERYPFDKMENWWLVIGELSNKELYAIKKVSLKAEQQDYELEFSVPEVGKHTLSMWCICDSYLDADKEVSLEIEVR